MTSYEQYRFGYQGQFAEKDEETGNHFELREYDPVIGRWLVPDPAKQYPSPYIAYGNDPINKVDPDGGCDTGDCPDNDGWGPSPESLKFQIYLAHLRAQATPEPNGAWQATKDFAGDVANNVVGLFTGETYSKIRDAVSFEFNYPGVNQVSDIAYNRDLLAGNIPVNQLAYDFTYNALSYGSAIVASEIGVGAFGYARTSFGPLKQWIRIGPSYSHYLGQSTRLSIRWGASPVQNWKFVKQIGDPSLRKFNQGIRNMKVPINNWRFKDAGHIHLKK